MMPKRTDKSPSIFIDINYTTLTHQRQSPLRTAFINTQIQSRHYHSTHYLLSRKHLIQRKKDADDIYRKIDPPEHTPPFTSAAPDVKMVEWRVSRWMGRFMILLAVIIALLAMFLYMIFGNEEERRLDEVPNLLLFMTVDLIKTSLLTDNVLAAKLGNDVHTDNAFVRVIYHHKDNNAHVVAPVWGSANVPANSVRSQSRVIHPTSKRVNNGTLTLHMIAKGDMWYVEHGVIEFADGNKRELKITPKPYDLRVFAEVREAEMFMKDDDDEDEDDEDDY
jgi:hypothetical protein